MIRISSLALFVLFFMGVAARALPVEKLELLGADKMETLTRSDGTYRRLIGQVRLKRGDMLLSCQFAEFRIDKDEGLLRGNVSIQTPDSKLTGEQARYYGDKDFVILTGNTRYIHETYILSAKSLGYHTKLKMAVASGSPALIDSASTLTADSIFYYETTDIGDARGNAFLQNESDSLSVGGQRLFYFPGRDSLTAAGEAIFTRWGTDKDTIMTIESDSLSLEDGYFFAWNNVKLRHGDALGTCGRAVYMQDEDLAIMRDSPVITETDYILKGAVFNLHLDNGDLRSIYVPEDPEFTQQKTAGDSVYTDWLNGQQMAVQFEDGQVRTVTLVDMATSFFNVLEDGRFKGSNKVSGDTLFILFSDTSISDITVSGGAEGVFQPDPDSRDITGRINYKASIVGYNLEQETTLLRHAAQISYLDMRLEAGQVGVYWRQNLLRARSLADTLGAEDYPVLKQSGQDDFRGKSMLYDLETQRGKVIAGRTSMQEGNYFGEELRRINKDVYFMENGYYTTCSLEEHPHFYFYSKQMKLFTDKIIIAKPVVLYIADIPLFALPFAVFPQKKGRSSGFILPSYDYRPGNGGRALKGFGYYWGINDYVDFKMTGDFWDEYEEFDLRSILRYKKRYRMNGNIDASMASAKTSLTDPATWNWKLSFRHSQTFDPSFSLTADGRIYGDMNFDSRYSHDQEQRLKTKLHSGVNLKKNLESIESNLTLNSTYDQDLQTTRRVAETPELAGITLKGPTLLFPGFRFSRKSKAVFPEKRGDPKWYNRLRWSYGNTFKNQRSWTYFSETNPDTLTDSDSLIWREEVDDSRLWSHSLSLSGNIPLFGVINTVGSINYSDKWAFQYDQAVLDDDGFVLIDTITNSISRKEVSGFLRRGTFSTSARFNTKLYGVFNLPIGPLRAVRHTITPSVSFSYTPDFSTDTWGYIEHYVDSLGNNWTYDPYVYSDIGKTPDRESKSMSYSLGNQFDYKLLRDGEERKGQFFSWTLSGNYNFTLDSLRASDIRNTFRINFGKAFQLSPRATFEIYERDSHGNKINTFRSPRLVSAGFNFGFSLSGRKASSVSANSLVDQDSDSLLFDDTKPSKKGSGGSKLWTNRFNFNYNYSHSNPIIPSRQTFQMTSNTKLNLTKNWGITYNATFNLLDQKLVSHRVGVTRDLHCWKMTLSWTPSGITSGFNLLIQPKANQLKDLKIEHKSKRRFYP